MKKITKWLLPSLMIVLAALSCQKEKAVGTDSLDQSIASKSQDPVTRAYRDSFEIWLKFKPDIAGGWKPGNPNSLAWWPGYGDGNATHMGNATLYFNQYTVRQPSGGVYMYTRPVTMFFATELQNYNVPTDVTGIVLDDKGNSIWFKNDPNGIPSTNVSPTLITFSGKMYIVGGTGKFVGATGETTLTGYFNPAPLQTDPNALLKGTLWHYGRISY